MLWLILSIYIIGFVIVFITLHTQETPFQGRRYGRQWYKKERQSFTIMAIMWPIVFIIVFIILIFNID